MTAEVIAFPRACRPRLTPVARAIYDEIVGMACAGYANGDLPHSIIDGIIISGGSKAEVVAARKELIASGALRRTREGGSAGSARWEVLVFPDIWTHARHGGGA